jgi:hypothetical protein
VADALVVGVGLEVAAVLDVVKVLDAVPLGHLSQDVHVAVGAWVAGEDVVVGDDDHTLRIPHLQARGDVGSGRMHCAV